MIKILLFFICCFFLSFHGEAANAPVTILPGVTACPGSDVTIPVTVTGFTSIGSVSLIMNYDPAVLTYVSSFSTAGFPDMYIVNVPGQIYIGGYSSSGITYPDNTVFFTVTFTYLGGTGLLTWNDTGHSCEYASFPGYVTMNDVPYASFYTDGQVGPLFDVDFFADNLFPAIGQPVMLNDLTNGTPGTWNWTISPADFIFVNGTSSASQNPEIQFTLNGPFSITLAATSGSCTLSKIKNGYIHSGTKGLWTGITSADWNVPSNWHNYMVPVGDINVVIPATSFNWPVYEGDLTIGSQCKTLTIEGISGRMTVTGKVVILPGSP